MIESPVEHHRQGVVLEIFDFQAVARSLKAITLCRPEQIGGIAAVAGDARFPAQDLQGHNAAEKGQDHGQTGAAALRGLHLEDGWGGDPFFSASGFCGHGWRSGCRRPWPRTYLLNRGRIREIGCCRSMTTEAEHKVPGSMVKSGPVDEDHL